jgi:hypothetical protein
MGIEAGLRCTATIRFLTPTCYRDNRDRRTFLTADLLARLVAIEIGHANIEEHERGIEIL